MARVLFLSFETGVYFEFLLPSLNGRTLFPSFPKIRRPLLLSLMRKKKIKEGISFFFPIFSTAIKTLEVILFTLKRKRIIFLQSSMKHLKFGNMKGLSSFTTKKIRTEFFLFEKRNWFCLLFPQRKEIAFPSLRKETRFFHSWKKSINCHIFSKREKTVSSSSKKEIKK